MFELIINKQDGSIYWRSFFNSVAALNQWLTDEQTRPYWKQSFTMQVVDHTPPGPTQAEIDAANAPVIAINTLKTRLVALANQADLTNADIKEMAMKLLKFNILQGNFNPGTLQSLQAMLAKLGN